MDSSHMANRAGDAITQYLAALQEVYPAAKGTTHVLSDQITE